MAVIYSTANVIANGNGEAALGATDFSSSVLIPGWTLTSGFTAVEYTAGGASDLNAADGLALQGGHGYFAGGPCNALSTARQTVDLSAYATSIDGGDDTFVLAKLQVNRDIILDFVSGTDRLAIDALVFGTGLVAGEALGTKFLSAAAGLAASAEDRLIYDPTNGLLFFDSNGTAAGGRALVAQFTGLPALTDADLLVVA